MIALSAKVSRQEGGSVLVRIGEEASIESGYLHFNDFEGYVRCVELPVSLSYLADGDIVRVDLSSGLIRVLYRKQSPHNFLFFTERCNSRCLMCSQPPREIDDGYLVEEMLQMIPMIPSDTAELGITGGEPTLLGQRFLDVISSLKCHLPQTSVHALTNGRRFQDLSFANALGQIKHPDLMLGIPLYADVSSIHDFVVQAPGAFEQTVKGLMNLARAGVKIEIRVVLHKQTAPRIARTARFIARNFPFVSQVAFMGLEMTGFARANVEALWIEPKEYMPALEEGVEYIRGAGIHPLIFNHQLCLLSPKLWRFSRKSISDWKNIYHLECKTCEVKGDCGGFFASSSVRRSLQIRPIQLSIGDKPEHTLQ